MGRVRRGEGVGVSVVQVPGVRIFIRRLQRDLSWSVI